MSGTLNRREFFEVTAGASAMTGVGALGLTSRRSQSGEGGPSAQDSQWFSGVPAGRSVVRSSQGMVATSQPLASQTGLDILKRGGNAVDAAIAMAAVLNVTEPNMTGIGGDAFMMVYASKTKKLEGLNASGRAPRALNLEHFSSRKISQIPVTGMEAITVPGAFDGWVSLLDKYGTMKLADLMAPAIGYAENGFPVMEKTAADWEPEVPRLKLTAAAASTYLVDGAAPQPGAIFYQKNLARTLRTLARGGRDAFYRGEIARSIVEYCQKNGGFLSMDDFGSQKSEWVEPISTIYRGHTLFELPPNGQGLTALLLLNILDGIDLTAMRTEPVRYYHTMIEATKIAFADRNRYIADPAFAKVSVKDLLSKDTPPAGARSSMRTRRSIRRHTATSEWAATRPTLRSSTRIATPSRSSTASFTPLDPRSSPARPASFCRIGAPASRSILRIPIASNPASGRFTRLSPPWSSRTASS